jgi:tRNA pseudouridine55 synthase
MYSALKHGGRPLYELARRGEVVERETRPVTIRRLEALDVAGGDLEFEVDCTKGTYVRVLGEEIAAALGTVGHLVALRRLRVEPFDPASMIPLEEVERWSDGATEADRPPWLLPVDAAFGGLARLDLDDRQARSLTQGRVVAVPGRPEAGPLRAYGADGGFLGLVDPAPGGCIRVLRLFVPGDMHADKPADTTGDRQGDRGPSGP